MSDSEITICDIKKDMSRFKTSKKTKEYKTALESAIYFHLLKLGIKHEYKNFNIQIENPRINEYRYFDPRFIVYYKHVDFSRFSVTDKNKTDEDVKFIFLSPWLIKKLFTITCRLKKK